MLAFVDESYQRIAVSPDVYLTTYSAVMLRQHGSREFAREFFSLKKRFWQKSDPYDRELKGRLLLSEKKIEQHGPFVHEVLDLARTHNICLFAVTVKGPFATLKSEELHLPKLLQFLLERINNYTALAANDCHAAVIFDTVEDKTNRHIANCITKFLFRHSYGQTFAHILDFPAFGDSMTTPGIQLADIVAYAVNNWHTQTRPDLDELFAKMRAMTHNWKNAGQIDYGFRFSDWSAQ